jgi:hypothetical protein
MKHIVKAIIDKYMLSLVGFGLSCFGGGLLFGFFHYGIEREATLITSLLGGLFYTTLFLITVAIIMIGITIMIEGDDHDLVKLIKKTKDFHQ